MQRHLCRLWLSAWLICQLGVVVSFAQSDGWQEHIDQATAAQEESGYEAAREQLDQALELAEEFGPEDPRLSQTLKALGDLEFSYDDYELTAAFYERALQIRKEHLEANDLDLARSHRDLAELYYILDREAEAAEHFERARDILQEVLGEGHNDVAHIWTRIGWNQFYLEQFEEAEKSFQYAIALRRIADAEPENIGGYLQEIGDFYAQREDPEEATQTFNRALDLWAESWGEADPRFIEKLEEIASRQSMWGQYDEQEALLQRALLIQELTHGPNSIEVAQSSSKIGDFWNSRDDPELAEHFFQRAVDIREAADSGSLEFASELSNLAATLRDQERYGDAIESTRQSYEIRSAQLESTDWRVTSSLEELAELYRATQDYDQSATLYKELIAIHEADDSTSRELALTLLVLGHVHMQAEEYAEAVEAYERAVATLEVKEDRADDLVVALPELAKAYEREGQHREAEAARNRAAQIQLEEAMGDLRPVWRDFAEKTFGSASGWVATLFILLIVGIILGFAAGVTALGAGLIRSLLRQHEPPPGAPVEPEAPTPSDTGPPTPIILPGESAPRTAHAGETGAVGAVWAVPAPVNWTPSSSEPEPTAAIPPAAELPIILPAGAATTPAPEGPTEPVVTRRFGFHGQGGSLFGIHIVNMLLALLTLGIYYFWGKIKALKYVYSQAEFDGDRFAFHGTGKELFLGWLRVIPFILLFYFFPQILGMLWDSELAQVIGAVVLVGGIVLVVPIAQIGAYRYRLSRTSWRGIRFSFRGRTKKYFLIYLKGLALTLLSLGLYSPVMMVELLRYQYDNTYFGNTKLRFHARAIEIFPAFILSWVLSLATLGLLGFWYQAELARYFWSHTTFATSRMRCTATGGGILWLTVSNGLLAVFTLGLAYPWVQVRTARYWLNNVYLENDLDMEIVEQDAQQVSAAAEGMADFLDLPMGF